MDTMMVVRIYYVMCGNHQCLHGSLVNLRRRICRWESNCEQVISSGSGSGESYCIGERYRDDFHFVMDFGDDAGDGWWWWWWTVTTMSKIVTTMVVRWWWRWAMADGCDGDFRIPVRLSLSSVHIPASAVDEVMLTHESWGMMPTIAQLKVYKGKGEGLIGV